MKYIGLSLSFCVRDIIEGKIAIEDVALIIAGTYAKGEASWKGLLDQYSETYWQNDPDGAKEVANTLLFTSRIFQPRVAGCDPIKSAAAFLWVEADQIIGDFLNEIQNTIQKSGW